jgi:hypothetical protein
MQKIVINTSFGKFCLSYEALRSYYEHWGNKMHWKNSSGNRLMDGTMTRNQKHTRKIKPAGGQASSSPADKDFTCSEVQLDHLLSEGESTGPSRSRSKDSASGAFVLRRKPTGTK